MKHALRLMLATAAVTAALLSPMAHAQDTSLPSDPAGGVPVSQVRSQFFPSSPSWAPIYRYWDEQGWGYLLVQDTSSTWFTNNPLVKVYLYQGGHRFSGSGIRYGGQLFFGIQGFFFQCYAPGWGSYHPEGYPNSQRRFYLSDLP